MVFALEKYLGIGVLIIAFMNIINKLLIVAMAIMKWNLHAAFGSNFSAESKTIFHYRTLFFPLSLIQSPTYHP